MLTALGLALDDDTGGEVRDSNSAIGLVHVLAACPGGTVRVHTKVRLLDVYLDEILDIGIDKTGCE